MPQNTALPPVDTHNEQIAKSLFSLHQEETDVLGNCNLPEHEGEAIVWPGDCLDRMQEIESQSVDLIVTSPPYADARKRTYGGIKPEDFVEWFDPRAQEMMRILKPTGSLILNIKEKVVDGQRHTYVLDLILHLNRVVGFRWVEEYIWHKTTSAPGKWKYRFRDAWERILHFAVSKDVKMNQDAVMVPAKDWTEKRLKNLSENDLSRHESVTRSGIGRNMSAWIGRDQVYPDNVLHFSPVAHNTGHSAAFPEKLPEFFIKLFSDRGDLVLDPFSGTGTTARVSAKLGRRGLGIEKDRQTIERIW